MPGRGGTRRRVSPLTLRILAVNVLALVLLMVGLLYLGRYQDRLIQAETEALETEARIFASALGEGAVNRILTAPSPTGDESGERFELAPELARPMIRRLAEATATRGRPRPGNGPAAQQWAAQQWAAQQRQRAGRHRLLLAQASLDRDVRAPAVLQDHRWPGRRRRRPPGRSTLTTK